MKASKPRKSSTEEDFEPPQVVIQAKPIMPTLIKPKKSSPEREFLNTFLSINCSNFHVTMQRVFLKSSVNLFVHIS